MASAVSTADLKFLEDNKHKIKEITEQRKNTLQQIEVLNAQLHTCDHFASLKIKEKILALQDALESIPNVEDLLPSKKPCNEISKFSNDICDSCNVPLVKDLDDIYLFCPQCGSTKPFIDTTTNALSFGDELEFNSFSYQRANHLVEWLNHLQSKQSCEVPEKTIKEVMGILFDMGFRKAKSIKFVDVRAAQKKLEGKKYYDCSMTIYCKITGSDPVVLDPELIEKIKLMFKRLQSPFMRRCPKGRKNFLSYSYVLYKLLQLLGQDELLEFFSLLKGKNKLNLQEEIFEKICADLNWPFIPIE